jgi:hypothetical protein
MTVQFRANPKALANLIHNALTMAKGKNPRQPLVYLRYTWDAERATGQLTAIGISQFSAGLDWMDVESGTEDGYAEIRLLGVNTEKTDVVDDLTKLGSAIRSTSAAASALVGVTLEHKHSISVEYGPELLGELADGDEWDLTTGMEGEPGMFDKVEDLIDEINAMDKPTAPIAFNLEVIGRCKDLKITGMPGDWGVVDLAQHPTKNLVGVAVGPRFRGVLGSIDRDGYAQGGRWLDGPGEPSHLLGYPSSAA